MKKNNAVMRSIVIISILLLSVLCGFLFQIIWDSIDKATHPKEYSDYGYWNKPYFLAKAESIGPETKILIERVIEKFQ